MRAQASALVEPGETVRHAISVTTGPKIAHSIGLIGVALLKFRIVAVTDAALYGMSQKAGGGAKAVEPRVPLGSVAVSTEKGPAFTSTLVIGQEKMLLLKPYKEEAEKLAAAAR